MVELTDMINAFLALLAAIITGFIVPWIKAKATAEQQQNIRFWVDVAVKAAEQYFGSGYGEEKKAFVVEWLAQKGFAADDALIEAAVNDFFGKIGAEFAE